MDPLGFGVESINAVGILRDEDNGLPIDSSGVLPDGRSFDGPKELQQVLASDLKFFQCAVKMSFEYALGRVPTVADEKFLEDIYIQFRGDDSSSVPFKFRDLVVAIVLSKPFRMRSGG